MATMGELGRSHAAGGTPWDWEAICLVHHICSSDGACQLERVDNSACLSRPISRSAGLGRAPFSRDLSSWWKCDSKLAGDWTALTWCCARLRNYALRGYLISWYIKWCHLSFMLSVLWFSQRPRDASQHLLSICNQILSRKADANVKINVKYTCPWIRP